MKAERNRRQIRAIIAMIALVLIGSTVIALVVIFNRDKPKLPPPPIIEGVEGFVLLDDQPLNKVRVRFVPEGEYTAEYFAEGVTDEAGRFTLTCNGRPGACAGENRVLVLETELPKELKGEKGRKDAMKYFESLGGRPLPTVYSNFATSPLTVAVTPAKKKFTIPLERK